MTEAKSIALVAVLSGLLLFAGCGSDDDSSPSPTPTPTPSAAAAACLASGGTVSSGLCCDDTGDFPELCGLGACGCAPSSSHEIQLCECGSGRCFDGTACVSH